MPKILIIDDDRLVRESTQIMLRAKGYDVVVAPDGKAGLDVAQSGAFDLAIVDLFMPGMDGLQVIKALHESRPDIPLIAASGFMFGNGCPNMPEFENMATEAGAVSTLYKPLRPREVLCAVEKAIGVTA
ncbi:MAG: response regulator [Xanthobacteraceae bacterium]|nr:response regulator [Xanthobacteraceae bacterium]